MKEQSPCYGCTERFTACSGRCPKDARGEYGYNAWLKRYHAQLKHYADNRYRFTIPMTVSRERGIRSYLRSGRRVRDNGGVK